MLTRFINSVKDLVKVATGTSNSFFLAFSCSSCYYSASHYRIYAHRIIAPIVLDTAQSHAFMG